ncbi:MAG: O-antigen/teichoic acid export membrane protein, partial [Candidatus Paceibacteria bacterium]
MFKHIVSNWSHHILSIVVMLVLAPMMLDEAGLGKPVVGIWVTIVAATGFIELLAMGVPMASVRHISEAVVAGDLDRTNRMISTGFGITLGVGLLGLVLGGVLFFPFEAGLLENPKWLEVPPEVLHSAKIAYVITAIRVAASLSLRFPLAVFHSKHAFTTSNMILNAGLLFRLFAVIALLKTTPTLSGLAWIFVIEAVGVFLALRFFIQQSFEGLKMGLASFDRSLVRGLLGFGLIAAVLNVGTMVAYNIDALVIGNLIDPDAVADFDVGNKFFLPLASIMYGIGAVVMPTSTQLKQDEGLQVLGPVFLKWSKVSLSIIMPVCLYLTILGPRFLDAWIADPLQNYELSAGPVTRVLAPSFLLALPLRAVALPILLGTSSPGRPAAVYLALAFANLVLSVMFVKAGYGIVGVAFGTAIPQVLFAVYLLLLTCKELKLSPLHWIRYVCGRASVGMLPCLALLLWLERSLDVH